MKKHFRLAFALLLLTVLLFCAVSCGRAASTKAEAQDGFSVEVIDEKGEVQKDAEGNHLKRTIVVLDENGKKITDSGAVYGMLAQVKNADGKVLKDSDGNDKTFVQKIFSENVGLPEESAENALTEITGVKIVQVITVNGVKKYAFYDENGVQTQFLYVEFKDSVNTEADTENSNYKKKWNEYILTPIGWLMKQLNRLIPNYIVTLFIFAILVKLIFIWFAIKQHKSTIKQAYFKPKEQAIRNKYKGRNDQATMQKMQQEIMDAQQKEGISTFSGCLPLLIQLPVIYLLYEVIRNPLSYVADYGKQCIASIKNVIFYNDLSAWDLSMLAKNSKNAIQAGTGLLQELDLVPLLRQNFEAFKGVFDMADKSASGLPNFFAFGGKYVDLSFVPTFQTSGLKLLYLLIPVITFVTLFLSMKINRKLTNQGVQAPAAEGQPDMRTANLVMDLGMPLMSTFFTFMFPALLGIYWIFNNLLGTLQQFILVKIMPYPVFTEEDYKNAEREYNRGKEVKKKAEKDPNKPKVRSLHHIDDDDDDYPVLPPVKEQKTAEESPVSKAPLKKDDTPSKSSKKMKKNQNDQAEEPSSDEK